MGINFRTHRVPALAVFSRWAIGAYVGYRRKSNPRTRLRDRFLSIFFDRPKKSGIRPAYGTATPHGVPGRSLVRRTYRSYTCFLSRTSARHVHYYDDNTCTCTAVLPNKIFCRYAHRTRTVSLASIYTAGTCSATADPPHARRIPRTPRTCMIRDCSPSRVRSPRRRLERHEIARMGTASRGGGRPHVTSILDSERSQERNGFYYYYYYFRTRPADDGARRGNNLFVGYSCTRDVFPSRPNESVLRRDRNDKIRRRRRRTAAGRVLLNTIPRNLFSRSDLACGGRRRPTPL